MKTKTRTYKSVRLLTHNSMNDNILSSPSLKIKQYGYIPLPELQSGNQKIPNRSQPLPELHTTNHINLSHEVKISDHKFEKLRMSPRNFKQVQKKEIEIEDIFGIHVIHPIEIDLEDSIREEEQQSSLFQFTFQNLIGDDIFDESFME